MALLERPSTLTEPGVYEMDAETYHADPVPGGSLSSSGARKLLPPSCPAKYRWERDHGRLSKRAFDLGHAAHKLVLGAGPDLVVIDADNYLTKAAKTARDEAHEQGKVPLLAAEWEQVKAMAAALRAHPVASVLLDPGRGRAEQVLIWRDGPSGVMRRAMIDLLPDVKTCHSADLDALSKAVNQHGYHQQGDFYRAGAQALGLAGEDAAFVFVCQEKSAPYLVTIIELDHVAMRIGAIRNRRALQIYAECTRTGHWPAYSEGIEQLSLPPWAEAQEGELLT